MEVHTAKPSKIARIVGWVLTIVPAGMLTLSAVMKFLKPPEAMKGMEQFGYPERLLTPLGVVELSCMILFVIPKTAVLGAILLTGYLGGATATHVRVGDPFIIPIAMGVVIWLAIYLRDPRLRALAPLRSTPKPAPWSA